MSENTLVVFALIWSFAIFPLAVFLAFIGPANVAYVELRSAGISRWVAMLSAGSTFLLTTAVAKVMPFELAMVVLHSVAAIQLTWYCTRGRMIRARMSGR